MVKTDHGFMLVEIIIAVIVLLIMSTAILPKVVTFYRQAAIEYETEQLLTTLRRAQSISRTTAEDAGTFGVRSNRLQEGLVRLNGTSYTLNTGKSSTWSGIKHYLLPFIRANKHGSPNGETTVMFNENGGLKNTSPLTIDIYANGFSGGRQIIIDQAGRIRLERGTI